MNILVILSGSIACYKACDAISQLVQRGHRVRCVATESALRFVGVATLEGLTREKVGTDLFAPGEALDHITLSRWADVTVVCPATANTLNQMAAGFANDLAGALLLAHEWKKPLLVAPAMNPAMWTHPATRAAVEKLQGWGVQFIHPGAGRTACGEVGEGRLAEPEQIVAALERAALAPERRLRVLVTSGGTSEPIDGVRVLTNTSSGATGALVADHFVRAGHAVLLVRAGSSIAPSSNCEQEIFHSFADLDSVLSRQLAQRDFDAVIHAAAVSDFSIESIEVGGVSRPPGTGKLPSGAAPTLHLRRNPKLLDTLRARSRNPGVRVVAFKLTRGADGAAAREAVALLQSTGAADYVVHNDLEQRAAAGAFPAEIWRGGKIVAHCPDRPQIAVELERLLTQPPPAVGG